MRTLTEPSLRACVTVVPPRTRPRAGAQQRPTHGLRVKRARGRGAAMASSLVDSIPLAVFCDSYKATHPLQYPPCDLMVAYGEFRSGYNQDAADTRVVHYGIRHLIETYLHRRWTEADLDRADAFFATHAAGGAPLPWPRDLFRRVVRECGGYFPIKVQALREGTCAHARVPAYQITAAGDYAPLCLFFETVLTHVWYPSTVATLSRRARDVIEAAFERGADGGAASAHVPSRLHDFGMRGCCTGEQAIIGGCAHLLSFDGSDTMPAAFHAQFHLNGGRPVASSIPATVRHPAVRRAVPHCSCINCRTDCVFRAGGTCLVCSYTATKSCPRFDVWESVRIRCRNTRS